MSSQRRAKVGKVALEENTRSPTSTFLKHPQHFWDFSAFLGNSIYVTAQLKKDLVF